MIATILEFIIEVTGLLSVIVFPIFLSVLAVVSVIKRKLITPEEEHESPLNQKLSDVPTVENPPPWLKKAQENGEGFLNEPLIREIAEGEEKIREETEKIARENPADEVTLESILEKELKGEGELDRDFNVTIKLKDKELKMMGKKWEVEEASVTVKTPEKKEETEEEDEELTREIET